VEQGAEDGAETSHVSQHLEQAHHGDVANVGQQERAFGFEAIPTEAEHLDVGDPAPEMAGQLRRVEITGGLAARDEEARSGRDGHAGAV
jgi:hypothetical protein